MKKTFQLQHEKHHPDRVIDSIKNELRKYLKREKKKKLPNIKTMYWDFDCRFGQNQESATPMGFDDALKALDKASADKLESCYIEVMAKVMDKPLKEEETE